MTLQVSSDIMDIASHEVAEAMGLEQSAGQVHLHHLIHRPLQHIIVIIIIIIIINIIIYIIIIITCSSPALVRSSSTTLFASRCSALQSAPGLHAANTASLALSTAL